jgi:Transcription factor WhiB
MTATWDGIASALSGFPDLRGARCVNQWAIWDETDDPEVIEYAQNQCQACPALDACRDWAATQRRLSGVVAGQIQPLRPHQQDGGTAAET